MNTFFNGKCSPYSLTADIEDENTNMDQEHYFETNRKLSVFQIKRGKLRLINEKLTTVFDRCQSSTVPDLQYTKKQCRGFNY